MSDVLAALAGLTGRLEAQQAAEDAAGLWAVVTFDPLEAGVAWQSIGPFTRAEAEAHAEALRETFAVDAPDVMVGVARHLFPETRR